MHDNNASGWSNIWNRRNLFSFNIICPFVLTLKTNWSYKPIYQWYELSLFSYIMISYKNEQVSK